MWQVWMGAEARLLATAGCRSLLLNPCGRVEWVLMVGVRFSGSTDASWLREAGLTGWNKLPCQDWFGRSH